MFKSLAAAVTTVRVVFLTVAILSLYDSQFVNSSDDKADRLFDQAGQAQNNDDFQFAIELWEQFLAGHKDDPRAIKAQHYAGVCHMTLKQYDKAIAAFSQVISRKDTDQLPQLEESYYYLGWCQFSIGQQGKKNNASLESAIQTFDQHVAKFNQGKFLDQAIFLKAESLYFLGKKKESIAAYNRVVTDHKKSTSRPDAIYAMGVSQFETSQYQAAEKTFELFLSEFTAHQLADDVRLFKAESVLQQGLAVAKQDKAAATQSFEIALALFQSLAETENFQKRDAAFFNQAICQSQLGQQQQAAGLYAQIASDFKNSPFAKPATLSAGKLYLRIKDLPKAQKWLKQASTDDPEHADEANHWLCRCLLLQNQHQAAAQLAQTAIQSATNKDFLVRLKMDRADALFEIPDRKQETIQLYQAIADEHSAHGMATRALYNAAFTCLELRQYSVGLDLTESFISQYSNDELLPDVQYVRAECFLLTGNKAEAEKVYKGLVENHASADSIHSWRLRYAFTLYLQDKYIETVAFLSPVLVELKQPADQAQASFLIGASQFYQAKYAQAIEQLEAATALGKQLQQVDEGLVLLAQSYDKQNLGGKAVTTLEKLVTLLPASRFVNQAHFLAGQYLAAEKRFAKAIEKFDAVLASDKNKYSPYALYGKGWALLNQGKDNPEKNQAAKLSFTTLIDTHAKHDLIADAFYSRAVAHGRTQDHKKAILDIDQCLKIKPDFSRIESALYEKGMALSASSAFDGAVKTFKRLVGEFESSKQADEYLYQLAWAYKSAKKTAQAITCFRQLAKTFPQSSSAAEAHYHIAEDLYQKKKFTDAITEYELAIQNSQSSEVGEKSRYKLAWSHYQKKDFDQARDSFQEQVAAFSEGDYTDSGKFMIAECYYYQDKYTEAAKEFAEIHKLVLSSQKTNATEKALACLHGAESSNKSRNYAQAAAFIKTLQTDLKDTTYAAEALLVLGNSYRGQKMVDLAMAAFTDAYDLSKSETGARAGFLVGELLFEQKKFAKAIRQYKLVIYGYGGTRAPTTIKKWQCSSAYETARCYHVQIKNEPSNEKRQKLIGEAKKFYRYVFENHPQNRLAQDSQKQLSLLEKIN